MTNLEKFQSMTVEEFADVFSICFATLRAYQWDRKAALMASSVPTALCNI